MSTTPTPESLMAAQAILARRACNLDPIDARKDFNANKSKLKADIKKATAFGKKMKTFTSEAEKGILQDLQTISVGMFVSEASQGVGPAVWEGKMKQSDVVPFVNSMSVIHQRYESFLPEALPALQSGFAGPLQALMEESTVPLDMVNGVIADGTRLRVAARVMGEMYIQGLIPNTKFFVGVVAKMAQVLTKPNAHITVNMLQLLIVILRAVGFEMTNLGYPGVAAVTLSYNDEGSVADSIVKETQKSGVDAKIAKASGHSHIEQVPQSVRDEAAAKLAGRRVEPYPSAMMAPAAERDEFVKRVTAIAEISTELCNKLRSDVETKWRQLCELTELQGEIAAEKRQLFGAYKRQTELFMVLTENVTAMMGLPSPKQIDLLAALRNSQVDQSVVLVSSSMADYFAVKNPEAINHYDSEDQRAFYMELIDIEELVPEGTVTAVVPKPVDTKAGRNAKNYDEDELDDYDQEEVTPGEVVEDEAPVPIQLLNSTRITATYETVNAHLLTILNIASAEAADQWVTTFLAEATKYFALSNNPLAGPQLYFNGCRRKLQKSLRSLGRCMIDTIPMVARVVATLSKKIEGLGDVISKKIEGELKFAIKKFSPTAYIRKTSMTRYLCELVKFRIAAPVSVISLFQYSLKEIENPHSVELILIMITNVTSFLLRGGVTRIKAEQYLVELKEVVATRGASIGAGQDALIDQALAELKEAMTADRSKVRVVVQRERSPLEQFLRVLLFTELSNDTVEGVCKLVRKLPWALSCQQGTTPEAGTKLRAPTDTANQESHYEMALRVFRKAHQCRWDKLHLLAAVVADTGDMYPEVGVSIVDCILEDIRTDLTVASTAHHQALQQLAIQSQKLKLAQLLASGDEAAAAAAMADSDSAAQSKSSLAKHLAKLAEPTRSASGLYSQVAARSNQKMLVDLKYLAELFNEQVLAFRSVAYVLSQLALFYPNANADLATSPSGSTSSTVLLSEQQKSRLSKGTGQGAQLFNYFVSHTNPVDYSRIRFICGFLDSFIPYTSVGTNSGSTLGRSESLVLERFLARFFLLIHSKAKPFPMDLDYKIAETMRMVSDTLYPYPSGYEHFSSLSKGSQSHKSVNSMSDIPKDELKAFEKHLDQQVMSALDKLYSNKEWRKMSSEEKRTARSKAVSEFLAEGYYAKFPKNAKENGLPYTLIGRLIREYRDKNKGRQSDKDDHDDAEAGSEIKEMPVLSRPSYFPKSRAEAEAHLDFLLHTSNRRGKESPGLTRLKMDPVEPPLPRGQTMSKKKKKHFEDLRNLAISAHSTSAAFGVMKQAQWFEVLCDSLSASATTASGCIFPVIGRSGAAAASSAQQPSLEADVDADEEEEDSTKTKKGGAKKGGTRAAPVEGQGHAAVRNRRIGQQASADEEEEEDQDEDHGDAAGLFSAENDSGDEAEEGNTSTQSGPSAPDDASSATDEEDDDDEAEDDRYASSDDDSGGGPAFGPQAFGLQLGSNPKDSAPSMVGSNNNQANQQLNAAFNATGAGRHHHHSRPEDAHLDRMMHQMLLESTGKAYGRPAILDQRLEQRLSDGYYRKAVDNLSNVPTTPSAAPPKLMKRATPSASEAAAPVVAPPTASAVATRGAAEPSGPPKQQFALLRRNNKGNAEAKPLFIPADSGFAQHVDEKIEEGRKEREIANKATIMLSRQQDAERGEEIRQKQIRLAAAAAESAAAEARANALEGRLDSIRFTNPRKR